MPRSRIFLSPEDLPPLAPAASPRPRRLAMSARLPLLVRGLRRPPQPPGPPRRLRVPCRASSGGGGGCGGGEGLLGQQRLRDTQAGSSRGQGSQAPPARDSIVR